MSSATINVQPWGHIDDKEVKLYTLKNGKNQQVDIINYGATIRAIRTPDKNGKFEDVVLGFDDIKGTKLLSNKILLNIDYKLTKNIIFFSKDILAQTTLILVQLLDELQIVLEKVNSP